MRAFRSLSVLAAVLSLAACQTTERAADAIGDAAGTVAGAVAHAAGSVYRTVEDVFTDDPDADAVALVRPTSATGVQVQGTVRFHETDGGMRVMASLSGLDPGRHGMHIHQNALCGMGDADGDGRMEPGGAAGGHWDPLHTMDHGAATEDLDHKHLGDLGNVTAGADGTAEATFIIASFPDDQRIAGHAIIVHADPDDRESDPGGTSGTRVGCGVIAARR